MCPRPRPSGQSRGRRPAAAQSDSSGVHSGDGSEKNTHPTPSVPVVTRAPPPHGTAVEVVVRYAYPGVRFSQAKVVMAIVPRTDGGEGSALGEGVRESRNAVEIGNGNNTNHASATITGARVLSAIEHDGVDLKRWRARVSLDHPGSSSGITRAKEARDANKNNGGVTQPSLGWRLLKDDDLIDFHETSVGLLVQLEDGLVFSSVDGDWDVRRGGGGKKGGGGRRGAKARAKRERAGDETGLSTNTGSATEESSSNDEVLTPEVGTDTLTTSDDMNVYRASSYWQLDDASSDEKSGNNPYAGAKSSGTSVWPADPDDQHAGFFGIGIVGAKHEANVGTLWRGAWQLGASFIFTVGARFKEQASDTTSAWQQIPHFKHERFVLGLSQIRHTLFYLSAGDCSDRLRVTVYVIHMARNTDTFLFQKSFEKFCESSPRGAVWVAIEMGSGSVPLQDFVHPPRALYFLGSEDNGLNRPIVEACHCHVSLPKWVGRSASYNVAAAGTVVMYDRLAKRLREGAFRVGDD